MTSLPILNPLPAPRETLYSYLSRLAATWKTDVADIAHDMGASFKGFLELDVKSFEVLADWADLDPQQMEELLSWTGLRAGNVRMTFRGELFVSQALRNPVMRGCPVCLREDVAQHDSPDSSAMVLRGDWQMREVNVCVHHGHPMVHLWKSDTPRDRYDIGARLREIRQDILSGALDRPETPPSPYDLWLDGRLRDGRDDTWFEGQPMFAATTFCRLLGQSVLTADRHEGVASANAAHSTGFNIARHGEAAIRDALDRVAMASTGHLDEPNKAFGARFKTLSRDYAMEEGFPIFAHILRACILDHWPVPPGAILLGEVVTERRLHSLVTAAKEIGIGPEVIEHFLIEAGALPGRDDRPRSRRVFDARIYADLLSEIPTLVGPLAMCKAMGATNKELKALEDEGLLVPRTRVAKVKKPWRISDGTDFVARLSKNAVPVTADADEWETLLHARRRTKLALSEQIAAIREQRLAVGQLNGVMGFHGLVVRIHEIDHLRSMRNADQKPESVDLPGVISAAEFGRSVGLRDYGNFIALVEAGQTPAEKILNPRTNRTQYRLSADDIALLHQRFVTLTTLSNETGHHRNTLKGLLAAARVIPFEADSKDFGAVYLRAEAAKAL